MGSPYFVHSFSRVSTVRSFSGLKRVVNSAMSSAQSDWTFDSLVENQGLIDRRYDCETQLFLDIMDKAVTCFQKKATMVLFLEARYEWLGWEKFQTAVVFRFDRLSPLQAEELQRVLFNYELTRLPD